MFCVHWLSDHYLRTHARRSLFYFRGKLNFFDFQSHLGNNMFSIFEYLFYARTILKAKIIKSIVRRTTIAGTK
jgi:hypothetical protein